MRFLHAADIHLDSPLAGLRARADLPVAVIRDCTRRAFVNLIDLAIAEDVAFVVLAGDLYDGNWKDFSTGLFFNEQMRRLGRPCYLLRGNHDAASVVTRGLKPEPNVHEFSSRTCQTFTLAELGVALHGHSFPNRAVPEDLSAGYCTPLPGWFNIGVLHTSADDPGEHATYAPCSVAALRTQGYDYWALGHIHAARVLSEDPWIVFPGNLQGRHPKETGPKGCCLVTVENGRVVGAPEHRSVDVLRWAALEVDVTGLGIDGVMGAVETAVRGAAEAADGRPILARLTLTGATPLHGALLGDTERLAAECRNAAGAAGRELWVEQVCMRTRPAVADLADSVAPLRAAFMAGLDDPKLVERLLKDLQALRQKVPGPARQTVDLPDGRAALIGLAAAAWAVVAETLTAADP